MLIVEASMKKVAVIYNNSDNQEVIRYLKENLEKIFENYIVVENYYLSELDAGVKNNALPSQGKSGKLQQYYNHVQKYKQTAH